VPDLSDESTWNVSPAGWDPTLRAGAGRAGPPPSTGARLGRFEVIRVLGAGGMGVVLEARDPELDRRVALKLLHAGDGSHLQREAQAMAKLSHPNVVAVHDVGRAGDQVFVAMELVDGETLRGWLRKPRSWREVLAKLVGSGRGLAAAHAAGLVHRDFKPDNVLIGADGRPRVTDFGLVSGDGSGQDGIAAGTPAYMSPEHWDGVGIDARSDQFSFCVTAWEALCGKRPFAGDSPSALRDAVRAGTPAPPPSGAALPGWLQDALRRGLATDPSERWPNLDALLNRLEAGIAPRRVAPWIAWGVTAAAAGVAIAFLMSREQPVTIAPPPAEPPLFAIRSGTIDRVTFGDGCEEAPALSSDGRTVYYDASAGPNMRLYANELPDGAPRELTTTAGMDLAPKPSPDGRRVAFLRANAELNMALVVAELARMDSPRVFATSVTRPFWSPDGTAVWGGWEALVENDVATGAARRTLTPPDGKVAMQGVALPDGRIVILTVPADFSTPADGVSVYAADATTATSLFTGMLHDTLALLPDGESVAVARIEENHSAELWRVPLDGSAPTRLSGEIAARNHLSIMGDRVAWSDCSARSTIAAIDATGFHDLARSDWTDVSPAGVPGTTTYYFSSDRGAQFAIYRGDRARPGPVTLVPVPDHSPDQLSVSGDGRWIAFVDRKRGLLVVPADGSAPPRLLAADAIGVWPTVDRHGERVYFERAGKPAQIVSVPVAGGEAEIVLGDDATAPSASPTADLLAYLQVSGEQSVPMILDLATGKRRPLQRGGAAGFWHAIRWSPDGTRVLLVSPARGLVEVEVATGKELRTLAIGTDVVNGATYVGDEILVGRTAWSGDVWTAKLVTR
jgi:Tol biopolymer transport system component